MQTLLLRVQLARKLVTILLLYSIVLPQFSTQQNETMLHNTTEAASEMSPQTLTPLMSWSQTPTTVSVVISLRTSSPIDPPSISITDTALSLHVRVSSNAREYAVEANWFGSTHADKCTWKRLGNGDMLLTIQKTEAVDWPYPFADRAYKGFVHIDWSRWVDEENSDDDRGEGNVDELGALSQASPIDFGGHDSSSFPSESNSEFQDLMNGLEKLGTDKEVAIPDMETLQKMSTDRIKGMLKSSDDDGCSEVDLDKVDETVAVDEDVEDAACQTIKKEDDMSGSNIDA